MADIRNLPVPDPAAPVVPELPVERVQRLEAEVEDLRAENQRLRALLNDLPRLTQRVLALRVGRRFRGPLLGIALGMAAAYILAIATPFDEQLAGLIKRVVAGNQVTQSHRPTPSAYPLPSSPTVGALNPSPAVAVPSPRTSPSPPSAAAPPIVTKPSLVPSPLPSLPVHPCSVTNGKPPQCHPTPLTP